MNKDNLQQIFDNYMTRFEVINTKHDENYKWAVAKKFRTLMDQALSKEGEEFAEILSQAKVATRNIIDSYIQPFQGMVFFAKKEPETVKKMFLDLYSDDEGLLAKQEKLIEDFFTKSDELLEKYTPDSFLYKQDSHAVSSYLFLYDPNKHYMYKASHSKAFADCIEFYDDWGKGRDIKLITYHRMCDELL
ncbi:hypothetical protein, partial [Petrocella sp. FN5]|uniref:hypothetical protein n=1 Tax=Petrocella sp. FN5 TaxID=3032002 RepID=UPI0023DA13FB